MKDLNYIKFILLSLCALLLFSGCHLFRDSENYTKESFVQKERENLEREEEYVKTFSLKENINLIGEDIGPFDGILKWRSFYFDYASSKVRDEYLQPIKAHANYLLKNPEAQVLLEGNADIRGSREFNIILGHFRAQSVANTLLSFGVPNHQIRKLSYGAEKPITSVKDELSYQLNRRVDLIYEKDSL